MSSLKHRIDKLECSQTAPAGKRCNWPHGDKLDPGAPWCPVHGYGHRWRLTDADLEKAIGIAIQCGIKPEQIGG
ncbi:MAG: hypothetical protein JW732_01000 [Dehalococcoidia bacterium]|nr:hypothetical protein [Dehalococcoidia bacterium]